MKTKNILTLLLALTFVSTATFGVAAPAYADCSINGQINSGGACSKSIKNYRSYDYSYQYQNRNYGINDQALLAMIARLQEMIRLLEQRLESQNYNYNNVSDVDVYTRTAVNIEDDSATLRGRVDLNNEDEAEVYFEYGDTRTDLDEETDHQTIDDNDDPYTFDEDIDDLDDNTVYYFRAVAEDENGDEDYGAIYSFRTDKVSSGLDLPELETRDEDNVTDDEAELSGYVDMNDFNNGRVFFVYGEDESQVQDVEDDYDTYADIEEDNDDLQKVSVDSDLDTTGTYKEVVDGLNADTRIYYSICVGFDDEDDDPMIMCGDTESFQTDDSNGDLDLPDLDTREADNITENEAELDGFVDMNDFNNGRVFFVYGEDESQVEDVEDDYDTYAEIDEDGDDLQKVSVDSDLDTSSTYQETVTGLDADTRIYYSICVGFDDEDDDPVIMCGDTESFRTDNN